jgi:hypothetical protein
MLPVYSSADCINPLAGVPPGSSRQRQTLTAGVVGAALATAAAAAALATETASAGAALATGTGTGTGVAVVSVRSLLCTGLQGGNGQAEGAPLLISIVNRSPDPTNLPACRDEVDDGPSRADTSDDWGKNRAPLPREGSAGGSAFGERRSGGGFADRDSFSSRFDGFFHLMLNS